MEKLMWYYYFIAGKLRRQFFMQYPETDKDWELSRICFIITGVTSVSIGGLIGGTFLSSLLRQLGVSDALNGIIFAYLSFATVGQLVGIQLTKDLKKIKFFTSIFAFLHRFMFGCLMFIPFLNIPMNQKMILFLAVFGSSYVIAYFINPCSLEWLFSVIPASIRGRYLGKRDAATVIGYSVVTVLGAWILDKYSKIYNIKTGFYIIGLMIFVLVMVDFIAYSFTKEPKYNKSTQDGRDAIGRKGKKIENDLKSKSFYNICKDVISDKNFTKVIIITIIYQVGLFFTMPFLGIYQISDLKLSYTFINVIMVCANLLRILGVPVFGKIADKYSFSLLLKIGLLFMGAAYFSNIFTVPANGRVMFTVYTVLHSMGIGVMGMANLAIQFEYAPEKDSSPYIAVNGTIMGVAGFLISLVGGVVVDFFQKNQIMFAGNVIYGQQVLSLISSAIFAYGIFYVAKYMDKKKVNENERELDRV